MESRRAISDLLSPSDARRRTSSAWSEALRGRPCWRPSCRACSIPARTRSLRISRSNSAKTATIAAMARPVDVVKSNASVSDTKATSSSWSSRRVSIRSLSERPHRSSRHTAMMSISRRRAQRRVDGLSPGAAWIRRRPLRQRGPPASDGVPGTLAAAAAASRSCADAMSRRGRRGRREGAGRPGFRGGQKPHRESLYFGQVFRAFSGSIPAWL